MVREFKTLLFMIALSLMITHELDAVSQEEWRILVVFRDLPSQLAETLFVVLHVPLLLVLLWLSFHQRAEISAWSRRAICLFGIVHVGLHLSLVSLPAYSFDSWLSQALIYGYGVSGALFFLMEGIAKSRSQTD